MFGARTGVQFNGHFPIKVEPSNTRAVSSKNPSCSGECQEYGYPAEANLISATCISSNGASWSARKTRDASLFA